jgi:hypothetical protein
MKTFLIIIIVIACILLFLHVLVLIGAFILEDIWDEEIDDEDWDVY